MALTVRQELEAALAKEIEAILQALIQEVVHLNLMPRQETITIIKRVLAATLAVYEKR
jgi:hypothetical protein